MEFYWLVLGILGVWQMTNLLHAADGPWQSLARLRALLAGLGLGDAVACFHCLSVWVALPVALWIGATWSERTLLWFALAGAASLVERVMPRNVPPPAAYFEDAPNPAQETPIFEAKEGVDNVQLRQQEPADGFAPSRQVGGVTGGNGGREIARSERDG